MRIHHLAHLHRHWPPCDGAWETQLHQTAISLMKTLGRISLPEYRFSMDGASPASEKYLVVPRRDHAVISAETERPLGAIVCEALLRTREMTLAVEIVVTHDMTHTKLEHYRRLEQPVISILLSKQEAWRHQPTSPECFPMTCG
jgi:hypothetical protein